MNEISTFRNDGSQNIEAAVCECRKLIHGVFARQ
jgi:hypothetical protein